MAGIMDRLAQMGPKLALSFLAAKQAGPEAAAAFLKGFQDAESRQAQQRITEQGLARQSMLDQSALETQAAQRQNLESDNARAEEQQRLAKLQAALSFLDQYGQQVGETAPDPVSAESQILGRAGAIEQMMGVPAGQLAGAVPNMAPVINRRKQKQAEAIYERALKTYGEEDVLGDRITIQTGDLFGAVKPSQLRAMFEAPAVTLEGQPATPARTVSKTPGVGTFEDYVIQKYGRRPTPAQIEEARRRYQQADDRPSAAQISIVTGPEGLLRVNRGTGEATPITGPTGEPVKRPPTEEERNMAARREKLLPAIEQMESLGARLITQVGPAQRAQALVRGWDAVLGNDPEYRTYQDARVALAGNLAVAQQGSRPSDADIRAVWLPLVPDVFRDTTESARMKWDMIRTNMSLPKMRGNDATSAIEDALKAQGITGTIKAIRAK